MKYLLNYIVYLYVLEWVLVVDPIEVFVHSESVSFHYECEPWSVMFLDIFLLELSSTWSFHTTYCISDTSKLYILCLKWLFVQFQKKLSSVRHLLFMRNQNINEEQLVTLCGIFSDAFTFSSHNLSNKSQGYVIVGEKFDENSWGNSFWNTLIYRIDVFKSLILVELWELITNYKSILFTNYIYISCTYCTTVLLLVCVCSPRFL